MKGTNTRQENAILNSRELESQKRILQSSPQYVTIGTHYRCNADCVFCLGGDFPEFNLQVYRDFFEKKISEVLKKADHIGFCGFGEVLLMPGIEGFIDHLDETLPGSTKVFTTNGIALTAGVRERLTRGRHSLLISLHAANAPLHEAITRTKSFDAITGRIKELVRLREEKKSSLHINLIFLVTTLNIENLPQFVMMAKVLGVDRVTCNYLTIFQPEQIRLSCFFQQEKTNAVFRKSQELAHKLHMTLILPPHFGEHPLEPGKLRCHDPWNFFYVETQGSVNPCCFAGNHIGYLNQDDFETIWNGPGYTRLREGLVTGEIHTWCRFCYKHNPNNVNDIRSHITFRPETQAGILRYIMEHRNEFPLTKEI